jgi:hypothetical protein
MGLSENFKNWSESLSWKKHGLPFNSCDIQRKFNSKFHKAVVLLNQTKKANLGTQLNSEYVSLIAAIQAFEETKSKYNLSEEDLLWLDMMQTKIKNQIQLISTVLKKIHNFIISNNSMPKSAQKLFKNILPAMNLIGSELYEREEVSLSPEEYFGTNEKATFENYRDALIILIDRIENLQKNNFSSTSVFELSEAISKMVDLGLPTKKIMTEEHILKWANILSLVDHWVYVDLLRSAEREKEYNNPSPDFEKFFHPIEYKNWPDEKEDLKTRYNLYLPQFKEVLKAIKKNIIKIYEEDFNNRDTFKLLKKIIKDKDRKGVPCKYRTRRGLAENLRNPQHRDIYGEVANSLKFKKGKVWTSIPPANIEIIYKEHKK